MYRDGVSATQAWRTFLPLLRVHLPKFLGFGAVVLSVLVSAAVAIAAVGLEGCCLGFGILALPYVGMVVMLPVWIAYRSYGPEFLAQFGERWSVFAAAASATPPPPDVEY
jgi:hypothetical protein